MMEVKMIKEGLLIPRSILNKLGIDDVEVLTRGREILVRPKTVTKRYVGFERFADFSSIIGVVLGIFATYKTCF